MKYLLSLKKIFLNYFINFKPKKVIERVRASWNTFATSTSLHGIPNFVSSQNVVAKIIWTLLFVLSVSGGLVSIIQTTDDYYQFDKITNVERVTSDFVTFPAITICTKDYSRYQRRFSNNTIEYLFLSDKSLDFFVRAAEFTTEKKSVNRNLIRSFIKRNLSNYW